MRLAAAMVVVLAANAAASPPVVSPPEDCQRWIDDAGESARNGFHAQALFRFEKAAECGGPSLVRIGTLLGEACLSKNAKKARFYFSKTAPDDRRNAIVWCVNDGLGYDQFVGTDEKSVAACDAYEQVGQERLASGQPWEALADFEAANACGPSLKRLKLTVLAACRARNEGKAKKYFARLPDRDKQQMAQICRPPSF